MMMLDFENYLSDVYYRGLAWGPTQTSVPLHLGVRTGDTLFFHFRTHARTFFGVLYPALKGYVPKPMEIQKVEIWKRVQPSHWLLHYPTFGRIGLNEDTELDVRIRVGDIP